MAGGARRWALAALWLALVMAVLDGAIANVALPSIARSLDAPAAQAIWIVNAYQLAILVSLLPLAALGQIVTFRRVFLAGLTLFVLASLGCSVARSLFELALARAVQGIGAACIMSSNGALLRFIFPASRLGRAVGLNALVIAVAAAAGPSVASWILTAGSWPYLFAVNVPIGLAALAVGYFTLPVTPRANHTLDLSAAVLNIAAFGLTIVGIDWIARGGKYGLGGLTLAAGVAAGWLLISRSRRQAQPLVPIDLLRNRRFAVAVSMSVAGFAAQTLALLALPFQLQDDLHFDQIRTGLFITSWPVAVAIVAPFAGRLADRFRGGPLPAVGLTVAATGLAVLCGLTASVTNAAIICQIAICGAGFGLFQSPNNRDLLSSAPMERAGAAGGMLAVARLTGQTIGATLAAVLFATTGHGPVWCLRVAVIFAATPAGISFLRTLRRHVASRRLSV